MINLTYKGKEINQREGDGYVNATQMCQANGKLIGHWMATEDYKRYTEALSKTIGIPIVNLVIVKTGRSGGTWIHPKLAVKLARWISVKFELWCDEHIKTLIETGATSLIIPEKKGAIHYYGDRLLELKTALKKPSDTWCVIEKCNHLLLDVERLGYPVHQFDLLDGSIGKHWSNYRKGKEWELETKKAIYTFPDSRVVQINAYQYGEVGYFIQWMDYIYELEKLPAYLESKYGQLVKQ